MEEMEKVGGNRFVIGLYVDASSVVSIVIPVKQH